MLDIEDNINDLYQKIENRIDEVVARLDNCNDHVKVQQLFSENNLTKTDIQNEWWKYEQYNLGKKLENILEDVEEIDRSQDWYPIVEKIQERFKDRFKGWWMDGYPKYTKQNTCIICYKEPNCLSKNNLSKKETEIMMY